MVSILKVLTKIGICRACCFWQESQMKMFQNKLQAFHQENLRIMCQKTKSNN